MKKLLAASLVLNVAVLTAVSWKILSVNASTDQCVLQNGNVNGDTQINLSDVVYLLTSMFLNGDPPKPQLVGDLECLTKAREDLAVCNAALVDAQNNLSARETELSQSILDVGRMSGRPAGR